MLKNYLLGIAFIPNRYYFNQAVIHDGVQKLKAQQKVLPTNTTRLLAHHLTSPTRIAALQNHLKATLYIDKNGDLIAVTLH